MPEPYSALFYKDIDPSADKQTKVNYMQKCLIFILIFFSLAVQARANWNPYSMDHERFVHLSEHDKRAVIISTMELMVELESKYRKEVKTSGLNQEKYDKFVQVILKLQNFVLNSAVAAPGDKSLPQLAGEFSKLLSNLGASGCVYGGYVSKMATSNGVKYCRHPSTMKDNVPSEAAIKQAYLSNGGACKGPHKISCNPVVFGYDSSSGSTPFCVETGYLKTGKAHNVSYDCMRKALEETSDKEARLKVLTDAMSVEENKDAFNKVHGFIFKTCACGSTSIDQDYARYIKPHRTCFGMMNTLRVVKNNECEIINNVDPAGFADQWSRYFGKADAFPGLMPERSGDFDKAYGSLIDQKAIQDICSGKIPVKPAPDPQDEKKWICETECKEIADEAKPEVKKIVCTVTKSGWDIIKDGAQSEVVVELETKEYILPTADTKKIKVTVLKPEKSEQECDVDYEAVVVAPSCTIEVTDAEGDPTKSKAQVSFQNLKDKEKPVFEWSNKGKGDTSPSEESIISKTAEAQPITVTFTIEGTTPVEGQEPFSCLGTIPPLGSDPSKDYGIKAKTAPVKPQDPKATVNATLQKTGEEKDLDKEPEGFHISWSREGAKAPKEKVKPDAAMGDSDPGPEKNDEKGPKGGKRAPPLGEKKGDNGDKKTEEGPDAVVEAAPEIGKGPSISMPREKVDYKVCAQLVETASGKKVAGPACDTIPALKDVAPANYTPGQNAPVPQFIMPVNNTRQMGIL